MVSQASHFDFEQARARLDELQRALDQTREQSPEQIQELLNARAAAYAQTPERALLASEQIELLTFELSGEQYAIESRFVSEVLKAPAVTDVPGTPPLLIGLTNLRSEILAVMDLAHLLGAPPVDGPPPWVLVVGLLRHELGIVAHDVHEVTAVRTESLLAPARASHEISREWIRGVTADAVVVLDGGVLLDDARLHIDVPES